MSKKSIGKMALFLIPIGVAVNFIGAQIAMALRLPVYLDAIGTILGGALAGGVPGAIIGVISNTINSITYPTYIWYGIISAIYGFLAAYLARKGIFNSLGKALAASLIFAVIGGTLNAIITWWLFGYDFAPDTTAILGVSLYNILDIPRFAAEWISAIVMDIADKFLAVLLVVLILRSIPKRTLAKMPLGKYFLKGVETKDADVAA